jgi:UDP-N-acetylglucosamine--N-acetylmuramyl-(pentapeptide) pyrophosphoryl-undecaprenol N-acetylglucosamine transferase
MEKKRVLITVGGTGGHIFPAIALAKEISPFAEPIFVGGNLGENPFFCRHGFPYRSINCAPLIGKNPLRLIKNGVKILAGFQQSLKVIRQEKPDLIVGFGSYYTFPTLLAAKAKGIPLVLHEANSIPGKVNRLFAPYSLVTGIHFPKTELKGKTALVGMPLREHPSDDKRDLALSYFGFDPSKTTLLVFGGSQGAQKLNETFLEAFDHDMQVLHLTGNREMTLKSQEMLGKKAVVKDFETRMDLALSIADVCITRAGAGTIAELLTFKVPSLLIPYPHATDNHQEKNADYLVEMGGAHKLIEKDMTPKTLATAIDALLKEKNTLQQAIKNHKMEEQQSFATLIQKILK